MIASLQKMKKGGEREMEFTQEQLKEMEELDKFYAQVREEEENEGDE